MMTQKKAQIERVLAGEVIVLKDSDGLGHVVEVKPPCSDKHNGYWRCETHDETFRNPFEKDAHTYNGGKHRFVWMCMAHGPEQP